MTAPGGSWAEAHVDVTLNFDDLDRDLIRRLERSSQIAQRAVNRNLDKIAGGARRTFEKIGDSYDRQMDRLERRTTRTVASINRQLGRIGRDVTVDVDVRLTGADVGDLRATSSALRRLQQDAGNIACRIDIEINSMSEIRDLDSALRRLPRRTSIEVDVDRKGAARAGIAKVLGSVGGLAKGVLGVVGTFGKFAAIAGTATVAAGALVPIIGALGSGLAAVGGAAGVVAVGGLMALGVAAAALKTAFTGVGEAAKLMFDPEKAEQFEEALAELTPAAQSSLRAFQKLGKSYADIVKTPVQETFFSGLAPKIAQLGRLLPAVRDSLVDVAQGFNDGANGALRMINSARGMSMVKSLLADAGNMGSNLGAAVTASIPGFLSLGSAATSVLSPMTDGIGGMARRWSESMLQMQQDRTLQAKMQGLLDFAKQVGAALAQVGSIIGGVFKAAAAAGGSNPLGNITTSLTAVSEWVNGPGQQALTSFFSSVGAAMSAIMPIFLQIAGIIGGQVAPMIANLITTIAPVVSELVSMIGLGIAALQPAIAPLGAALSSIGTALAPVMPILGQLIAKFVEIAGPVIGALAQALGPAIAEVGTGLVGAFEALMPAVGPIGDLFVSLSPVIAELARWLGSVLGVALSTVVPVLTVFAGILSAVMPAVQGLLQMLSPLAPTIGAVAGAVIVAYGAFKLFGIVSSIINGVRTAWTLLSLAFSLSPIGMIIVAVAALAAGLALFFTKTETGRRIWETVWGGIKAAASAVVNWFTGTAWPFLQGIFQQIGTIAMWLWQNVMQPAWQGIQTVIGVVWTVIQGYFNAYMAVLRTIGTVVMWLWNNVMAPAWSGIQAVIGVAWSVIQVVFQAIQLAIRAVSTVVMWLWNTIFAPAFAAISALVKAAWSVLSAVFNAIMGAISAVGQWVMNLWNIFADALGRIVTTVSGWVSSVVGFFADLASKAIGWVTNLWNDVTSGFSRGVSTAVNFVKELPGKIMDGLKNAGTWLVDTGKKVIQGLIDGIKSMGSAIVNALINLLPGPLQGAARSALGLALGGWLPGLAQGGVLAMLGGGPVAKGATTPVKPGGFIVNARQTRKNRGLLRALAPDGRVLSGPGTGTSDSITGMSNGRPVAKVSRGEYYVPPRTARRIMPQLTALNSGQRLAALATGGRVPYGLPAGTDTGGYGSSGSVFPEWVHAIERKFNVKASTYAGHQESDGKNKGIDWSGSVGDMQRFAEYLLGIKGELEQVIWMNPETGEQIGVADGKRVGPGTDQPGYYRNDWADHQNHVHTRQSYSFGDGMSGTAPGIDDTAGLGTGTTSSSGGTPIGSGIGTGSTSGSGSGSGASWGNSGGGSRFNSAEDAKRGGLTPVWVENWPATIGGGGALSTGTTTGGDLSAGSTTTTGSGIGTGAGGTAPTLSASSSKKDVAAAIYAKARDRGYSHEEALAIVSTAIQESNLDPGAQGGGGAWHGIFQQDESYPGRDDPNKNIDGFLDRLDEKTKSDPKSDIWKRIFWLQQRPGESTADAAYGNGRQAYLDEIQSKQGEAKDLVGQVPVTPAGNVPVDVKNTPTDPAPTDQTTTTSTPNTGLAPNQNTKTATAPTERKQVMIDGPIPMAGEATKTGTADLLASWLGNGSQVGLTEQGRDRLIEGLSGAASTFVTSQMDSALGMFGMNQTPTWMSAINRYQQDNSGSDKPASKKDLTDLFAAIASGNWGDINVTINGDADGQQVADRIDKERRRKMRRYTLK